MNNSLYYRNLGIMLATVIIFTYFSLKYWRRGGESRAGICGYEGVCLKIWSKDDNDSVWNRGDFLYGYFDNRYPNSKRFSCSDE